MIDSNFRLIPFINRLLNNESRYQLKQILFSLLQLPFPSLCFIYFSLQSIAIMRFGNPLLPLTTFTILLITVHISTCRHVPWAGDEQTVQKSRTKLHFSFPKQFSDSLDLLLEDYKLKPTNLYVVSHPVVPCGPNPLHN
ncbi:hypothetical protein CFOL_v3_24731 [Cephalotus follicularis]|uniref:Uncharacterized protein n=1 Tax=Cephalotus follicularis TaxID=3775 RepID=A0A1Q3CMF3_CEPFO|nr:hypothetical protein CFOL_v3_24731 [Cephalotus follicularis]